MELADVGTTALEGPGGGAACVVWILWSAAARAVSSTAGSIGDAVDAGHPDPDGECPPWP